MRIIRMLLLMLVSGAAAWGQSTVYKSVDEHGVVTFSDKPPADAEGAERMEIDVPPASPDGAYQANLEAMRETTDRMAADRREREKHRAELREIQARTNAYEQSGSRENRGVDDYGSGYITGYPGTGWYRPGRPPWRPGHGPKPEHPIARPPYRPPHQGGPGRPTDNNAQLMRPITGGR